MDSGAILTGIIATSAASIAAVVTKDAKVSEFRQQWIDSLREDVAKMCSVSVALYWGNVRYKSQDHFPNVKLVDTEGLVEEANNLGYRIRLRLDPRKPESAELIAVMDELVHNATHAEHIFEATNRAVRLVLEKAHVVLDKAWVKVRQGEARFRLTLCLAVSSLAISVGLALAHWLALQSDAVHKTAPWLG
jgi:hypothetical protein